MLPPEAFYLPFEDGPYRMTMGVVARDPDEVFELDALYAGEMAQRRDLLGRERAEVLAVLPGMEAACQAVLDRIVDILPRRFPSGFRRDGDRFENRLTGETWDLRTPGMGALELAGRLVQDDLCLLRLTEDGPVLSAGVVCFPTSWRLVEKIGQVLQGVHRNVPIYPDRLGRPVDRLIAQLRPGKVVERLNWGIYDSAALFRPGAHFRRDANAAITPGNAGQTLFLRVERQTLSVVRPGETVLFTIRTHVYPLHRVTADPAVARRLAGAVRELPPAMHAYKSLVPFGAALLAYLDGCGSALGRGDQAMALHDGADGGGIGRSA